MSAAHSTPRPRIAATGVPPASLLRGRLAGVHFHDCFRLAPAPQGGTALELYLATVAQTPRWVDVLMAVRNRVVGWFGLQDLGMLGHVDPAKAASDYRVGDRIGIFNVVSISDDEVVVGNRDRHLTVQLSVCRLREAGGDAVAVSTVVHIHRLLGRLYMLPVAPVHKLIVPAMLRRLARRQRKV